jgi:alpha-beta hydrolase superfamily lysophospholipase
MGSIRTDVLGEPFTAETIELEDDAEGCVVATLVKRAADTPTTRAVLYVHGFSDYFFHVHVAELFTELGYDFYALDLRKYGRSLLPHQTHGFCTDLAEYHPELDAAHALITERDSHDVVVIVAHSTGGLIAPLWADARRRRGRKVADAFILNSPWLDLQGSLLLRTLGTRAIDELGSWLPYQVIPRTVTEMYTDGLHSDRQGEWDYDLTLKPATGLPIRAGWLRAVRRGHRRLHRGIDAGAPVLVLASKRTSFSEEWSDDVASSDIVLDVEQIAGWAHRLGQHVTIARVEGAIHDVFLSGKDTREEAFEIVRRWLPASLA